MSGCTNCPPKGERPEGAACGALHDWRPVAKMLRKQRLARARRHLKRGQVRKAARALSVKPSVYCVCTKWSACKPYYLRGYYAYCESGCGTYAPC